MTTKLEPGTYALEDYGEAPDGKHNARDHGMVRSVRVTPPRRPAANPPTGAASVSLEQRVPRTLPRRGTLAISTKGRGFYELVLGRVDPKLAARELRKAQDGNDETFPETKEPVDLLSSIGGGQTAYVATRLRPGTYIVLCFAGRPGSDAPTIHGRTAVVR